MPQTVEAEASPSSLNTSLSVPATGDPPSGANNYPDLVRDAIKELLDNDKYLNNLLTKKYSLTIGNGTDTQIDVTHNFATDDVTVEVYEVSTKETVLCDVKRHSTNVVRLNFDSAPASNSLRVVVIG